MRHILQSLEISDAAQVGAARRAVARVARELGFSEQQVAELEIVVQEIGTNAARYATGERWIHFGATLGTPTGLEIVYWDKGPGIYDIEEALRDGYSTGGGLGAGLGAIRRLSDEFEIYSSPGASTARTLSRSPRTTSGTVLLVRKWADPAMPRSELDQRLGLWSRPRAGEEVNGDAFFARKCGPDRWLLAVIDGIGHGQGAQEAARAAVNALDQWSGEPLEELIAQAHEASRGTRGSVVGVALLDTSHCVLQYAGVGNIEARAIGVACTLISMNGTLGARLPRVRVHTCPWPPEATLVIASDGLSRSWDVISYPALLERSPQLIASVLMRDYGRMSDDATVLVAR